MNVWKVLQWIGLAIFVVGELGGVFSNAKGDTFTEQMFKSPVLLALTVAFLFWGVWHFVFAWGKPGWFDFVPLALGTIVGAVVGTIGIRRKKRMADKTHTDEAPEKVDDV